MYRLTVMEAKLALREPVTLVVTLAFPIMLLVILLAVFGNQPDEAFLGVGGTDYYVPAYAASVIAATGLIALPVHLAGYKERGIIRRFEASGVGNGLILASQAVVMLVIVAAGSVLMVTLGFAGYDLSAPEDLAAVLIGFVVGSFAFAAFGVLLAALLPTARAAQSVGLLLFFGMFFIVGGGPPRSILPTWMGTVGDWMPMTYLVRAVQSPWIGQGWDGTALAVLAGFMACCTMAYLGWTRRHP